MSTAQATAPRQVKLKRCVVYSPGMEARASAAEAGLMFQGGFDVSNFVNKIDIFESIFENTISGQLSFIDIAGLPEYIPFVGVEFFFIHFSIDADEGEREFQQIFRIVSVRDTTYPQDEKRTYTVDIVTPEYVTSISSRVQRHFRNVTCAEAVTELMLNDLVIPLDQIKTLQQTQGKLSVTVPNYTPLQAVNYFTMLSLTKGQPSESNFMFFQTLDGFHFTSIAELIKKEPTKTFNVNAGKISSSTSVGETTAFDSIIRLHQEQSFNALADITSGVLRSRMLSLDFLSRKWTEEDSRYSDTFNRTTHMDKYPLYPVNYDLNVDKNVKLFIVPTNVWTANSRYVSRIGEIPDAQRMHQSIVLRNRQLRELMHLKTLIDIPGQPDLRAGSVVNVHYPSTRVLQQVDAPSQQAQPDLPSTYYSGKHLVTAVRHSLIKTSISSMEYRMHIEVTRDSLRSPLPNYAKTE